MKSRASIALRWITESINLQLMLLAGSLPITTLWGLQLSPLTVVGTLLFAPIATLFLLCSTLLMIAAICNIPHGLLHSLLEQIGWLWHTVANSASNVPLMGMPAPPLIIALVYLMLYCAAIVSYAPKIGTLRSGYTYCTFIACWYGITLCYRAPQTCVIALEAKQMHVSEKSRGELTIIATSKNMPMKRETIQQWAQWTLYPALVKKYGSIQSVKLALPNPTYRLCIIARALHDAGYVHRIVGAHDKMTWSFRAALGITTRPYPEWYQEAEL